MDSNAVGTNLNEHQIPERRFGSYRDSIKNWVESFVLFRDAIYKRDKIIGKTFFKFPIINTNNEIWYLIYEDNDKQLKRIPDTIKPFSEKDLDDNFNIIFTQAFRKSLLKIDTTELHNKFESQTEVLSEPDDPKSTYQTFARMDTTNNEFTLSIVYRSIVIVKDENENPLEEMSEFSVIYVFNVIDKKYIEFEEIRLAG